MVTLAPYPRALVQTCGMCPGCRPSVGGAPWSLVCPELLRSVEVATFPARARAAFLFEVPELAELHRVHGASAPPAGLD